MTSMLQGVHSELSLEDWASLDEDESGELVDGHLTEEEMPTIVHEVIVTWLIAIFRTWLAGRGGLVLGSEHKLAVGPQRGRKADVAVYLPGSRFPGKASTVSHTPPDLVVEVVSPRPRDGRRDRIDKKREYAAFCVPNYWIVDPQLRTLEVLVLDEHGRYADALSVSEGAHDAPGCDGLRIDLDAIWAELDQLPDEDTP